MLPIDPHDERWSARRDGLLDRVHDRGHQLRRRRQIIRAVAIAAVLVLLAGVPALALRSSPHRPGAIHTVGRPSTTEPTVISEVPETTTSTDATATSAAPSQAPATTTPPKATTTTTARTCRNSYNPDCGPFYWDPPPAPNQPLTVDVTVSPSAPRAGQEVTFTVTASDPDARVSDNCAFINYGDQLGEAGSCAEASCAAPYGPWTPPPAEPGRYEHVYRHVYANPGSYTATFRFQSHSEMCSPDPYGETAGADRTVTVSA